jgi:M6 family metalloprotease-like protein
MRVRSGTAVVLVLALSAGPLAAQQGTGFIPVPPPKGQKEVRGLDFRPDGGLRVQYRTRMLQRSAMMAAGNIQGANALQRTSGFPDSLNIPVIFFYFKNGVAPFDTVNYQDVFFAATPASRPYSLRSFYQEMSHNRFDITGDMHDWVMLSQDSSYYGANCRAIYCSTGIAHLYSGLVEAITKDSAGVDWSKYDANGDGVVDFVIFVQPLLGGECIPFTTTPTGNNIWAHRYSLTGLAQSGSVIGGGAFVTNTPWPGHPGQFIKIDDYTVQSGQGGSTSCTAGQVMPIGTVAHETGHTFGLPDLYDTDQNQSTATEGIGSWGLMGSGNYTVPESPSFFDAWSRFYMGWATFDTLATSATTTLGPVETSDTVLYVPSTSASEFYLVENRQPLNADSGMISGLLSPSAQKGPGLLVWHVDQTIVNGGMASNTVNSQAAHGGKEGVELLQADGLNQLRTPGGGNRGDAGDPFPGTSNNHSLGYSTNPSLILHSGGLAGFKLDSIYQVSANGPMVFRFLSSAPWLVSTTQAGLGAQVTVNGVTTTTFRDIFALGDSVHVSVADSQLVNSGRTRLLFGGLWSNGQTAKSFALAAAGTPDTAIATFSAQHKVKVVVNGLGKVNGPAGDTTAAGVFINAGTGTTLTATPDSGQSFSGWTGDTTTTNLSVVLPMNRPYNLTANFSGGVTIVTADAASELLGVPTLTPQQKTYLDQNGNSDAVYNLGDFLAWLKAKGIVATPPAPSKEK